VNGPASIVGLGGAGLVFANFWLGNDKGTVAGGLFGSGDAASAHKVLLTLGGEMLFVIVATVLAGASDAIGTVMVVLIVGLWILWAMHHYGGLPTTSSKGATSA
jgi:hypothetical protein